VYSGAWNASAIRASGGDRNAMMMMHAHPANSDDSAAIASAGPGASLLRHRVAVEADHDRRRLARHVEHDRRRRPGVARAIVDAGQHDERRQRRHLERERQQHRDRDDRADAGQDADERAEQRAAEAVQQVLQRHRDGEAVDELGQRLHRGSAGVTTATAASPCRGPSRTEHAEHREAGGDRHDLDRMAEQAAQRRDQHQRDQRDDEPRAVDEQRERDDARHDEDERLERGLAIGSGVRSRQALKSERAPRTTRKMPMSAGR
jgi:hypothetical protein